MALAGIRDQGRAQSALPKIRLRPVTADDDDITLGMTALAVTIRCSVLSVPGHEIALVTKIAGDCHAGGLTAVFAQLGVS